MDIWVVSTFWLLQTVLLWSLVYNFLCRYVFNFLGSKIVGSYGSSMINFSRYSQTFPRWLCHFTFPTAVCECSNFSTSLPALVIAHLFNSSDLMSVISQLLHYSYKHRAEFLKYPYDSFTSSGRTIVWKQSTSPLKDSALNNFQWSPTWVRHFARCFQTHFLV
jgi:hypothetical protein